MRLVVLACCALLGCRSNRLPEVSVDFDAGQPLKTRAAVAPRPTLRVSVAAMMSPAGTFESYRRLLDLLGDELGASVELVQRRTYRETNDLLAARSIDLAFVCTGGFIELGLSGRPVEVLAVPEVHGQTTYRSLLIVPATSTVTRLEDLEGRRFAFTDELSLSGYAWPTWLVREARLDPVRFFSNTYFTHSHDRSVEAVAKGLVEGAAVDSVIFADMVEANPALQRKVRVIRQSEPLGMPPLVASEALPPETRTRVKALLTSLHERPEGARLLAELGIERFVEPSAGLYELATQVVRGSRP